MNFTWFFLLYVLTATAVLLVAGLSYLRVRHDEMDGNGRELQTTLARRKRLHQEDC